MLLRMWMQSLNCVHLIQMVYHVLNTHVPWFLLQYYGPQIIAKELGLEVKHPDVDRVYVALYKSFIEVSYGFFIYYTVGLFFIFSKGKESYILCCTGTFLLVQLLIRGVYGMFCQWEALDWVPCWKLAKEVMKICLALYLAVRMAGQLLNGGVIVMYCGN